MSEGITIMMGTPEENGLKVAAQGPTVGVGTKYRAKVVNFKPYGFFVETADGGFGLVHGRNIKGWDWHKRFDRVFRHGTEVDVTVIDVEPETNRMSFSCEMPVLDEEADAGASEEAVAEEAPVVMPAFKEMAEEWAEKEPEKSAAAFAWLKTELEDGPLYGPLTTVLCDRFGVPVPVSRWIRKFPDFTCYSGKGDNPSDLPAVALSSKAGDLVYWKGIKTRTENLLDSRNRPEDPSVKLLAMAERLSSLASFPGTRWIGDYRSTYRALEHGAGVYGAADVAERLAIPMLAELGWNVSADNAAFVRGGADAGFNAVLYGGPFGSGKISVALLCSAAGTRFDTLRDRGVAPAAIVDRNVVERLLGFYNQIGGTDVEQTKVVWTNGAEWVVLSAELLMQRIGILADRRGAAIMDEASEGGLEPLGRVELPAEGTPLEWLAAFARLHGVLGK